MNRALAALAALLIYAGAAEARTAIVVNRATTTTNGAGTNVNAQRSHRNASHVELGMITSFINRYNPGSYDIYYGDQVRASLVKSGSIMGRSYSQVIWAGTNGMQVSNVSHTPCHECSLTFIATSGHIPTVPQLFLSVEFGQETGFFTVATCSTGIAGSGMDPGTQGPTHNEWRNHIPGSPKGWPGMNGLQPGATVNDNATGTGTMPSGTFRVLLGADGSNLFPFQSHSPRPTIPAWRDSIIPWSTTNLWSETSGSGVTNQSYRGSSPTLGVIVAVRYNDNPAGVAAGAKPNIFCNYANSTILMSGGDVNPADDWYSPDPQPLYMAIAFLDSLSGGDVLGSNGVAKMAVQVSGGFRRGLATSAGGIAPNDTANFKLTLDSLKTLNIPISVGVNVDSLSDYASDLAMWRRAGSVRFTLEPWQMIADTTISGSRAASSSNTAPKIIDPFGRFRPRIYVGPATDAAADTSIYALLRRGKNVLKTYVAPNAVDGILMAADDDYSPLGSTRWRNARFDSLAIAIDAAGFSGVAQNADDSLNAGADASKPKGWTSHQQFVRSPGDLVGFITHPGFNPRGGTYGNGNASPGMIADSNWCVAYTKRSLFGLYNNWWEPPHEDRLLFNVGLALPLHSEPRRHAEVSLKSNVLTGTNLVRITASSLGSGNMLESPNMPGYFTLKYLKYQVDAINAVARRKLIVFVYPDELGPEDIKR